MLFCPFRSLHQCHANGNCKGCEEKKQGLKLKISHVLH